MITPDPRFTEIWDAVDPFDRSYPHLWIKVEHLGRYLFAAGYLADIGAKVIADIGCGRGFGSFELSSIAERVLAIDSDDEILTYARDHYGHSGIEFIRADIGSGELQPGVRMSNLDAVVCFETLEHLIDPEAALAEIAELTRPDGCLIASVPSSVSELLNNIGLPSNRLHKRQYSVTSFNEMLESAGFEVVEVLGQPLTGEINRNETALIRRRQTDGRIGDEPSFHDPTSIRRLAMAVAYPEARDIERSYSIIAVARPVTV